MTVRKAFLGSCAVLLCTSLLLASSSPPGRIDAKSVPVPGGPGAVPYELSGTVAQQRAVSLPQVERPETVPGDISKYDGGPMSLIRALGIVKQEQAIKDGTLPGNKDGRACADCATPNTDLGDIGGTAWGYTVTGDCGTEGKWYASFNGYAGYIYHWDLCTIGTSNFDSDIKICDASCNILAGVDGNSACNYNADDFTWTCTATGTYYVVIAPYNSYASHTCGGTAANAFTLAFYAEPNPCAGNEPANDDCSSVTPTVLTSGVPATFMGDNTCAQPDCSLFPGDGNAWEAFTLSGSAAGWDITLDYCGTTPAFGNAWLNLTPECPCVTFTAAGAFETTSCGDGNVTIVWTGMPDGTYYYPVLRDPANGAEGPYTINVVAVEHVASYCDASGGCDEYISQVDIGTISNATGCDSYADYTAMNTDLQIGVDTAITIQNGNGYSSDQCLVWVDWNQDLDFDDAGEAFSMSGSPGAGPYTGMITAPPAALLGPTRMRVRINYNAVPPTCGTTTYGEVEDYTVTVRAAPPEGACCLGDLSCVAPVSADDCVNVYGGVYQGDGSDCDPNPCKGACCMPDGSCDDSGDEDYCLNTLGGTFQGYGTTCASVTCPSPGDDCGNPGTLTLSAAFGTASILNNYTCGRGNAYADTCLGYYDGGEDYILELTITDPLNIMITLDPKGTTYGGFAVSDTCPPGAECMVLVTSSSGSPKSSACTHFEPGVYYVMVDTWPSPDCIPDFDLTFEECTLPLGRCCYDPWPNCVDGITDFDCTTLYGGDWTEGLDCSTPCPQDVGESCDLATVIPSVPYIATFNNDLYTADGPGASCDPYGGVTLMQNDAWFTWTSTEDCFATATVTPTAYNVVMVVWSGPDCLTLTEVACANSGTTSGNIESASFSATAGTTYWFQMGDTGSSEFGGATQFELTCSSGVGACCFIDGHCEELSAPDCLTAGGDYQGDGTGCDPNPCPQPIPGDNCGDPLPIDLPAQLDYTDANQYTCGRVNDYADTCMGSYDGGEDIVYEITVTDAICVDVTVTSNNTENWIGIGIGTTCPLGATCLAAVGSSSTVATIPGLVLTPGTYYMMVDTWPSPNCLSDFNLTITASTECAYGACCDPMLGCYETYEDACTAAGGTFVGEGTTCSGLDCNTNGVDDTCDILLGTSQDCNANGIPDECDLASGTSVDYDQNGIPDECDPDCNANGVPDPCDIDCMTGDCANHPLGCGGSEDCQGNGIPDECELGAKSDYTYLVDDGTHEDSIGITAGARLAAINHFTVVAGAEKIDAIEVAWGNCAAGIAATVYVWEDPNGDGDPTDAQVIASAATVTANVDTDVFNVSSRSIRR